MLVGNFTEQRFLHGVFIKQPKIGIVRHNHQVTTCLGLLDQNPDQGIALGDRRSITTGIVGEIQDNHRLALFLRRLGKTSPEGFNIKTTRRGKCIEFTHLRLAAGGKGQVVVAP